MQACKLENSSFKCKFSLLNHQGYVKYDQLGLNPTI